MKFRMIAVILGFAMGARFPTAGQQVTSQCTSQTPAAQDSSKGATKHSCCCSHENQHTDSAGAPNHDQQTAVCGQSKDRKGMACCSEDAKDSKDAMTCGKGKDAKLCAAKDGESCWAAKDGKPCCGKDAAACNTKAEKVPLYG